MGVWARGERSQIDANVAMRRDLVLLGHAMQ